VIRRQTDVNVKLVAATSKLVTAVKDVIIKTIFKYRRRILNREEQNEEEC